MELYDQVKGFPAILHITGLSQGGDGDDFFPVKTLGEEPSFLRVWESPLGAKVLASCLCRSSAMSVSRAQTCIRNLLTCILS